MFSGNKTLLVASPTLQDYLVDKTTGLPLANGVVTFYEDDQRQTLKNVYYQQGIPGSYTYTALPNPLTLSSVGTIADNNGNDVIPFFYPIDETDNTTQQLYYVTVYSSLNVLQFTRQGFPFVPSSGTTPTDEPLLQNYLYNNLFWRNSGANSGLSADVILAPGAHDGFVALGTGETINGSNPAPGSEIRFIKSKTGATDKVSYNSFGVNLLPSDVTPEYYVNVQCTASTTGENYKVIQIPVQLHIANLQNVTMTFTIWAQGSASGTNTLDVFLYQFLGIGAPSQPAPVLQGTGSIELNTSWTQYTVPVIFTPLESELSLGSAGDDAYYIQIGVPLNTTFNINFAKPCLFLGSEAPASTYTPYDQIDSIIGTSRTGDVRVSLNNFSPYGWVAANDGSIGSATSGATTRANQDTFALYHLLWNNVGVTYAPMVDSSPYGSSAYADFIANRAIYLTKTLGRVLASIGTPSSGTNTGTNWALGETAGNELHTLSIPEMPAHSHTPNNAPQSFVTFQGTQNSLQLGVGFNVDTINITSATGGGSSFNIQNPVTYFNVFIKL